MAILFDDASSEYLEYAGAVRSSQALSMACWFNTDDNTIGQALISIGTNGGVAKWVLSAAGNVASDPVRATSFNTGGTSAASSTTSFSMNTWHHAGAVFASNTSRTAYLDGVAAAANTTSIAVSGIDRTTIGARWSTTLDQYMSGMIAEAAVWSGSLTDADMLMLSKGFCPLMVKPATLIAYWPLIGRSDPSVEKHGGFGMTWNNTPQPAAHPRIIYPRRQLMMPDYTEVVVGGTLRTLGLLGVGI